MSEQDAGPALDARIAVEVMGLKNVGCESNAHHTEFVPHTDGINFRRVQLRQYSTDIAAAFLVVEKLRERGVLTDIETLSEEYRVTTGRSGVGDEACWVTSRPFFAASLPLAICAAALSVSRPTQEHGTP